MQIDADCRTCPLCGAAGLTTSPVIHHMVCAYVGPDYDYGQESEGYLCPKCRRVLRDADRDWEVVGTSARCPACGGEFMVSEPPAVAPTHKT